MSDKEILEKAVQKAIDGGFNPGPSMSTFNTWSGEVEMLEPQQLLTKSMLQDLFFRHSLLFNHDFAKALWGDKPLYTDDDDPDATAKYFELLNRQKEWDGYNYGGPSFDGQAWQFHLQQMVIAEDPIKYLGDNI